METIEMALAAAETGHLVFGTLHNTNSALQTINRLVDVFSSRQTKFRAPPPQLRINWWFLNKAAAKRSGRGRTLVMEIMRTNNAIRNLIREEKLSKVYSSMQVGQGESGMQTMNQSLIKLVQEGIISEEVAIEATTVPDELVRMITGIASGPKRK